VDDDTVDSRFPAGCADQPETGSKSGSGSRAGQSDSTANDLDDDRIDSAFVESLATFDEALSAGSIAELADPPELESETDLADLEQAKACLLFMEQVWPRAGSASAEKIEPNLGRTAKSGIDSQPPAGRNAGPRANGRIGKFQVKRKLGQGGGGIVWLATDTELNQVVALKVPLPEIAFAPNLSRRFLHEARAATRLAHPSIVRVREAGHMGSICYIAFEYCEGPTLTQWLAERRHPVPGPIAARLVADLADAVEHAHSRDVLHRDIKPSNILLAPRENDGQPVADESLEWTPMLTDFGLAKVLERSGSITRSGAVLGTAEYMAPEQAEGRLSDIGPATDVYGLGAVLYELLTGRPPFQGANELAILNAVKGEPPRRPSRFQPGLPPELEAICLKCLEKEPARRYPTAALLYEDLQQFLAGKRTSARPDSFLTRAWKWGRRRPAITALLAVVLFSSVAMLGGFLWHRHGITHWQGVAQHTERQVEQGRRYSRQFEYAASIQAAYDAWQNDDVAEARDLLARWIPHADEQDVRGFEWHYLRRLFAGGLKTLVGHRGRVFTVAFSADGQRLASGAQDGTLRLWDPATGDNVITVQAHELPIYEIAFSPDGRWLASASEDGSVKLWDAKRLEFRESLPRLSDEVDCVAFSVDSRLLASAGADGRIRVWDLEHHQELRNFHAHDGTIESLVFRADGKLVSGGADKRVRIWDLDSAENAVETFPVHSAVRSLASSSDGGKLYCAYWKDVRELSASQGAGLFGHKDAIRSLTLSADGETLVSSDEAGTIIVWDAPARTARFTYRGHLGRAYDVALSPDGTLMASGGRDGTVRLWDPRRPQERRPVAVGSQAMGVSFSPDGGTLAVSRPYGDHQLLQVETGQITGVLQCGQHPCHGLAYSPTGEMVATVKEPGQVVVWNLKQHSAVRFIQPGSYMACVFSPDGKKLLLLSSDEESRILDPIIGRELAAFPGHRCAAYSPDGRRVAIASKMSTFAIELWEISAGRSVVTFPGHEREVSALKFSRDGKLLASASLDGTARIWDVASGKERQILRSHLAEVMDIAFSPDQRSVVTSGRDGIIKFWQVDTGTLLLTLNSTSNHLGQLAFSPDGRILATTNCAEGHVDLWYADESQYLIP
jgi:WD40 repeat protein/serine/threonine protein kinase